MPSAGGGREAVAAEVDPASAAEAPPPTARSDPATRTEGGAAATAETIVTAGGTIGAIIATMRDTSATNGTRIAGSAAWGCI